MRGAGARRANRAELLTWGLLPVDCWAVSGARIDDERRGDVVGAARQPVIGYLAPNVHGYFYGSILGGVMDTAAAAGARVVAIQAREAGFFKAISDEQFTAQVAWDNVDAMVVVVTPAEDSYMAEFAATGKPLVTMYAAPSGLACPTVVPDNVQGVAEAVDHRVGHGHTQIAFAGRDPANADDGIRYDAYRQAMQANGLAPADPIMVPWTGEERHDGSAAVRLLRERDQMPTAVVACTDATAMAVAKALTEDGLLVPDDVAVIGFDDIAAAAEYHPPLTTVAQSFSLAGVAACTLALRALGGEHVEPGQHCVPVKLVVRESCGCRVSPAETAPVRAGLDDVSLPFVDQLGDVLYGAEDLPSTQHLGLRVAVQRLVALFVETLRASDEPSALVELDKADKAATDALRRAVAPSLYPLNALLTVRALADAVAEHLAPGDTLAAAAVHQRAVDVATRALQFYRQHDSAVVLNQHVDIQRRHYRISTELVRRKGRNARSLAWLADTGVRAASLALWNDVGELRLVGAYPGEAAETGLDEPCDVRAFPPPPPPRPDEADLGELTFVVPVTFDGNDHGFLALTGAFDVMAEAVFERVNHWAVLLSVALEQDRALERLRVSEERYALAAEAANDGMWDWDLSTGAVYYSARWKALLGYTDEELEATSREWLSRIHPDDRAAFDRELADLLSGLEPALEIEYRLRTADGSYRWMITNALSVRGPDGRAIRLVGSMTDVSERKALEERLRNDAHYDPLTGLPNRALFLERLEQTILRARRSPDYTFAVVFLDLDGFKVVNDSLGHQVGDELLIEVAKRLSAGLRAGDTVSRFGGDEFVLLLDDVRDVTVLPDVVRRLLTVMSVPVVLAEGTRAVSAAAGIAVSASGYTSADEYLRDADTAMYRAKALGPGSVVMFDGAMHARAMARLQLESALDQGIALEEFELYYQPIVRLDTRRIVGLEALIRWNHPERGLVPPNDFLPVAEATGQTRQIGQWTITEACRQLAAWQETVPGFDGITVSVNLSNRQFWDPGLLPTLRGVLERFDVPASSMIFEVTEGVIMHNQDVAVSFLRQLRDEGIEFQIDDFGTGHSSLSALHELPVTALKIDRSFIQRMQTSTRSRELVSLMIAMGSRFGLTVIAEGVETEEEAAALAELDCPFVQGYLFSRPVPAAEATRLLLAQADDALSVQAGLDVG